MNPGKIYLIPTPIGETEPSDVTPLGNQQTIRSLDYFVVENLRSARRFLRRAGVERPIDDLRLEELNEHTPPEAIEALLRPVLQGQSAGIISEAGVPAVADPGADLVALAHRHGVEIVPLVGPSSILLAVMASGLNGQSFAFNGYLPIKQPERNRAIRLYEERALRENQSQFFIEAPYRNTKLFDDLIVCLGAETRLTVAVDILQPDQLIRTRRVAEWKKEKPDINKRPAIFGIGR
ncbi:MAG: SAM-dependent methyltransferase [Rikenellaceae bacterium]|jgi:16S rRNA (cytidine1402-2'-O)-methyltransferase|nr:SAM-dependent methyltransferase [Rikenellaceae bacterium]